MLTEMTPATIVARADLGLGQNLREVAKVDFIQVSGGLALGPIH